MTGRYNPAIHHRRSIRLKGYDYGKEGLYFITICTFHRANLFGRIEYGQMELNNAEQIAQQCWSEIPRHFPNVVLHQYVIMPNHIHGIVQFVGVGVKNILPLHGTSKTVGAVVRGFKIGVTKWMRQNTTIHHVWQRNYWEHIIRDKKSYNTIAEYIKTNPLKWETDALNHDCPQQKP